MSKSLAFIQSWIATRGDSETGATMVEYGLMVSLIAIVCIAAITLVGTNLSGIFTAIAAAL